MSEIDKYLNKMQSIADKNTAKSQSFAREEMNFNSKEAQKNRDWQKQMSDTAHQREVNDLVQAGLNPVLSSGGQGASVGSGATASGSKGEVDTSIVPALTQIINTQANNAAALERQRLQTQATIAAANAQASAAMASARIAANASMTNAQVSAAGNYYTSKYVADTNYKGTKYSAKKHQQSTEFGNYRDLADKGWNWLSNSSVGKWFKKKFK